MGKTLYVTDLDGTLMRDDKSLSVNTVNIINNLIKSGILITYATARSINSASVITKDINFCLPVITLNGTVIVNPVTKEEQDIAMFPEDALKEIRQCAKDFEIPVVATLYTGKKERKLYLPGKTNKSFEAYLESHASDKRFNAVNTEDTLYSMGACYFLFIADKEESEPLYQCLKDSGKWICHYQQDKYRKEYWLEISPEDATKAEAVRKLKEQYKCSRVVVFGDSLNDTAMFKYADEAYAVANAEESIKKMATGIIGSNNSDGVAEWLYINAK